MQVKIRPLSLCASLLLGGVCLTQTGCLVTSGSSITETGMEVSGTTLNQIEIGQTTESWLIATLGEPSQRTKVSDDGGAILRYDYRVVQKGRGTVFLIFAGGSRKERVERTFFEVENGVVTRWWRDS